jgi:hypothetical protein
VWGNSYPLKSSSTKGLFGSIEFFYKNWFLALAHKNWFLKKLVGVFGDQFLKAENQFLEMEMTYVPLI